MKYIKYGLFAVVTVLLIWALVNGMRPFACVMMWVAAWYLLTRMGKK